MLILKSQSKANHQMEMRQMIPAELDFINKYLIDYNLKDAVRRLYEIIPSTRKIASLMGTSHQRICSLLYNPINPVNQKLTGGDKECW